MYFKCIWWYIYTWVLFLVFWFVCVYTLKTLGYHGAGSVTAGGTGGCCDDILWCRVVAGSAVRWPSVFSEKWVWRHPTHTCMLYVAVYVYVCMFVDNKNKTKKTLPISNIPFNTHTHSTWCWKWLIWLWYLNLSVSVYFTLSVLMYFMDHISEVFSV